MVDFKDIRPGAIVRSNVTLKTATWRPCDGLTLMKGGLYKITVVCRALFSDTRKVNHDVSIHLIKVSKAGKRIGKEVFSYSLSTILRDCDLVSGSDIEVPITPTSYPASFYVTETKSTISNPKIMECSLCRCSLCRPELYEETATQ